MDIDLFVYKIKKVLDRTGHGAAIKILQFCFSLNFLNKWDGETLQGFISGNLQGLLCFRSILYILCTLCFICFSIYYISYRCSSRWSGAHFWNLLWKWFCIIFIYRNWVIFWSMSLDLLCFLNNESRGLILRGFNNLKKSCPRVGRTTWFFCTLIF